MTNELLQLIDFRAAKASDVPFILATWLRGLKFGNSWFKLIESDAFYEVYHKVLERILVKPQSKILVACLKEDPEVILGYSVVEDNKLHWVHVKKAWRKSGIAKALVPGNIKVVTHLTDVGKAVFLKKKDWVFNPFFT